MAPDTGKIVSAETLETLSQTERQRYTVPVDLANLSRRARAELRRTGETQILGAAKCPCGSGRRFKKCHKTTAALQS